MNYFITAIFYDESALSVSKIKSRTFGYFKKVRNALNVVRNNDCDLNEYLYNYLVIEEIGEGVHPSVASEIWFKWTGSKWERISDKSVLPEKFFMGNWALG